MPENPYDILPYRGFPRRHAHPEVMAANARLFGLNPPAIKTARILEIGCGDGANLLSIACSLPKSACAGVDASSVHIKQGQAAIEGTGLRNVALLEGDFTLLAEPQEPYDYIIAHGLYSWITPEAQQSLLAIIKSQLAPNGVAFVSYNCYPGWNLRQLIRELMLYRTRFVSDPQERVNISRQILPILAQAVPSTMRGYAALLQDEQFILNQTDDYYIAHEHLEAENRPCYFHQFAERLGANGLQFLCEAELSAMFINRFPAALGLLQSEHSDVIEAEQLLDFAVLRMFRQTLICHDGQPVSRQLTADVVRGMRATAFGIYQQAPARFDDQPESFQGAKGATVTTANPLCKAAMMVMAERWPERLAFSDLEALARQKLAAAGSTEGPGDSSDALAQLLLAGATAEVVELHTTPGRFISTVSERPVVSELARYQARSGGAIGSLRHQTVNVDPVNRHLIQQLDGTRDLAALVEEVVKLAQDGRLGVQEQSQVTSDPSAFRAVAQQHIQARLAGMARNGLLVG